jgi:hypothetical protein
MHVNAREFFPRQWQSEANLSVFLLILVVVGFVLPSLGFERNNLGLYATVGFSILSIVGTAIAWRDRTLFVLTAFVAAVAILVRWAAWWKPSHALELWSLYTGAASILAIAAVLLWQVFRPGPVTVMRVQGGIAAYLCLGYVWAHAYHIAAIVVPGSFSSAEDSISAASSWVNYSFGMLTTVGYAGITPVHPVAHSLGSAEAVTGQLYLAVLVARLVAMQVTSAQNQHP